MDSHRPDPDALLRQIQSETNDSHRGRLKIFLGASAGVGKTYAMLTDAHEKRARGIDVVIGYVETHKRAETEALVQDLPTVPLKSVHYRGVVLSEFDLDAVLLRKPALVLVDELPHTNAPGSRHVKRWQDIEELLEAGIDVTTALNIQHIESLRDHVAGITNIRVQETVPDAFVDRADEIELVDIPPDELRQRLREGKVYIAEKVDQALEGFFKKHNLLSLRELALRKTADRVDAEIKAVREGESGVWTSKERILVCVAPNRLGEKVVRSAARFGGAIHAEIFALFVESSRQRRRSPVDLMRAEKALRLAERMGMETARRAGSDIVGEILDFAHKKGVTLIVVGKPIHARWRELLVGSVVDELVRRSGDINVHVLTSDERATEAAPLMAKPESCPPSEYWWAVGGPAAASILGSLAFSHLPVENVVAIYMLAIAYVSSRVGLRATALACVLSVAAYDFFFVHPQFTFSVSDVRYLPTFGVMLLVALLISRMTLRLREDADAATTRERRTASLYELSRDLARTRGKVDIAKAAAQRIKGDLEVDCMIYLPDPKGELRAATSSLTQFERNSNERPVAQWAFEHGQAAGHYTDTLPGASGFYLPLVSGDRRLGAIGFIPLRSWDNFRPEQRLHLETFANTVSLALERAELARESSEARLAAESEQIRSSLLSSVSHDIRSPLTAIAGAASSLMEGQGDAPELSRTIYDESMRLNRHVRNLLDMTRLNNGSVKPRLEWNSLEELVGSAIARTEGPLQGHFVSTSVPVDLPLIKVDGNLVEQALINLLENAAKHTPAGSSVMVSAKVSGGQVLLQVADDGPGVPDALKPHLFEKFRQMRQDQDGFGLGLAIAKAVANIHAGTIAVEDRPGGGTVFSIALPRTEGSPEVPVG